MREFVLVIHKENLPNLPRKSFIPIHAFDIKILQKSTFIDRAYAENDNSMKQLIPYSIFIHEESVFHYLRSSLGKEPRLHKLYSIGIGGHVNPIDASQEHLKITDVLAAARDREIKEEIQIAAARTPMLIGLITDDTNEVGTVHLGVVYEYHLLDKKITPKEEHLFEQQGFTSVCSIVSNKHLYESWSSILAEHYLSSRSYPQ